jgi:hypothetical protein
MTVKLYDLEEAAAELRASSVWWLTTRLRTKALPGRKIGRRWFMTEDDLAEALDLMKSTVVIPGAGPTVGRARRTRDGK